MSAPALPRYPGIDSLRGMAVLLVVCLHLAIRIPLRKTELGEVFPRRLLNAICFNGYESVFVFFVISGFLITTHALARHGTLGEVDLRGFYARRLARIGPPLLILVLVLSLCHLAGVPRFVIDRDDQSLPGAIVAAFGLHLNWYEGQTGYLPGGWDVLWSLSVEECFYLAFPLICLGLKRGAWIGGAAGLFALSLPWFRGQLDGSEVWREKAYLPGMAAIATGVGVAVLAHHVPIQRPWVARAAQVLGGLAIASVFGWGDLIWGFLDEATLLLVTFGTALMIWGFHGDPAAPWPGLGWLRACGRLSYEIYLTHMFVVFGAIGIYQRATDDLRHGWLLYPPVLAACWLLGALVARFLSEPADKALRARLLSPPVPAAAG